MHCKGHALYLKIFFIICCFEKCNKCKVEGERWQPVHSDYKSDYPYMIKRETTRPTRTQQKPIITHQEPTRNQPES